MAALTDCVCPPLVVGRQAGASGGSHACSPYSVAGGTRASAFERMGDSWLGKNDAGH